MIERVVCVVRISLVSPLEPIESILAELIFISRIWVKSMLYFPDVFITCCISFINMLAYLTEDKQEFKC